MHRIKLEWIGTDKRGRPRYRAWVIRLRDGKAVFASEADTSPEVCWEDAAHYWRTALDGGASWASDEDWADNEPTAEYRRPAGPETP